MHARLELLCRATLPQFLGDRSCGIYSRSSPSSQQSAAPAAGASSPQTAPRIIKAVARAMGNTIGCIRPKKNNTQDVVPETLADIPKVVADHGSEAADAESSPPSVPPRFEMDTPRIELVAEPAPAKTMITPSTATFSTASLSTNSSSSSRSSRITLSTDDLLSPLPTGNAVNANRARGLRAHNSTLNVFVDTTIDQLQLAPLVRCVAAFLLEQMYEDTLARETASPRPLILPIFDEEKNPTIEHVTELDAYPSVEEIEDWLHNLLASLSLSAGPLLVIMIFIDRLRSNPRKPLAWVPRTWRRMMLASIIVAAKIIDDLAVWTSDVLEGDNMTGLTVNVDDLNALERISLSLLDYDVNVKANAYASIYFDLREFAIQRNLSFVNLSATIEDMRNSTQMLYSWSRPTYSHSRERSHEMGAFEHRRSASDVIMQSRVLSIDSIRGAFLQPAMLHI